MRRRRRTICIACSRKSPRLQLRVNLFTVGDAKNYAGDAPGSDNARAAHLQIYPRRIPCPPTPTDHGSARRCKSKLQHWRIFRLCDAFLVRELVICGAKVDLRKRKLVQAAQGTQHWVPWSERQHASEAVAELKARGAWVLVAEQTTASVRPEEIGPVFPATLVLGGERSGVSPEVIEAADAAVVIPMIGWRIRSMWRPLLPFCFTGSHSGRKREKRDHPIAAQTNEQELKRSILFVRGVRWLNILNL